MLLSTVCNMLYFTQSRLLPDADGFGFIPTDYADTVRGLEALHGDVTWRRLDERSLRGLADKQVVGLVELLIRGDYWQHGYLINHSVASGDLLYHLEELARRWA